MSRNKPEIFIVKTSPKEILSDYNKLMHLANFQHYYHKNDKIIINPPNDLIENLDDIPSPYRKKVFKKFHIVQIEIMRGCPLKCAYCFEGKRYNKVRYFSLSSIYNRILL